MGKLFLGDNFLTRFVDRLVDCIFLSILWSLTSLPIITAGAASSALYYTVHKCIYEGEGHIFSTFFRSFWQNRRQSTLLWLLMAPIGLLLFSACYLVFQWCDAQVLHPIFFPVVLGASALIVMWLQYWFCYSARFEDSFRGVLRNTFLIAAANFGPSFLLMLVFALIALVVGCLPQLLFLWMIFPGLYGMAAHQTAEHLFRKYLPDGKPQETEAPEALT